MLREEADELSGYQRLYPDPDAGELRAALKKPIRKGRLLLETAPMKSWPRFLWHTDKTGAYTIRPSATVLFRIAVCMIAMRWKYRLKDLHVCRDYQNNDGLIVIANPNAPTGCFTLDEIAAILSANPDHPVVIDEAYVVLVHIRPCLYWKNMRNLIVVQTFSKSRSLAGLRFGFAAAAQK